MQEPTIVELVGLLYASMLGLGFFFGGFAHIFKNVFHFGPGFWPVFRFFAWGLKVWLLTRFLSWVFPRLKPKKKH